jgi:heptaprenyl diphosphate synthase
MEIYHVVQKQQNPSLLNLIPEMHLIESKLYQIIGSGKGTIHEMCSYLLQSGGKRLRPLLVILSGKTIIPHTNDKLIAAGAAAELIHMASLVHDDIIDESLYRRGKPSVNALWGKKHAVLAGDFLFARAFDLMVTENLYPVLKLMVTAIQNMCAGEIEQENFLYHTEQSETDYFNRINKKTAQLLSACCESGALISGGDQSTISALRTFGTNLGYVFQIIDDVLDFTGKSDIMGKPACQDLSQGNLTLPVIYLMQHPKYGNRIKNMISSRQLDQSNISVINQLLEANGFIKQALDICEHCAQNAKNELAHLPEGMYRNLLEQIVDKALNRKS